MIFRRINMIIAAAGLGLALAGCIRDDLSDCVWENATLTFHYTSDAGADLFPENINSVDAFIFDVSNLLVAHKRFDRAALDEFRGWKLTLPEDRYRALCWANVDANSCFSAMTPRTTTMEECTVQIDAAATVTGDRLFYAPKKTHPDSFEGIGLPPVTPGGAVDYTAYEFTIVPDQSVVKEMHFTRAHRTLNVYVQGFSDGGRLPVIDVSNLWGQYDFLYNTLGLKFDFTQASHAVTTDDGPAALSTFHHAFGEVLDDMVITIRKASDNSAIWTVNLKEFLDANPDAYKNDIDVLITFSDMGVTVSIPGWLDKPITPGI